jgi:hypothetical protein
VKEDDGKLRLQIGTYTLELENLDEEMNKEFHSLYQHYFSGHEFNITSFKKRSMHFFDENLDSRVHDKFFNNFTILWQALIRNGSFFYAEQIWQLIVEIAREWEVLNQYNRKIHKGTAYYFWGTTCILKEDLEKGFLLMHQALEEDRQNRYNELADTPAYAFVKLDYKQQKQFFGNKVQEIANFLEEKIETYQSSRRGNLSLEQLKSKFLDNADLVDNTFLFVYELFHIRKLLSETKQELTRNIYGSLLTMRVIFTFILIIDNVIKQKYYDKDPHKQDFINLLEYLSKESNLTMDISKLRVINERANTDLTEVVLNLLNSKQVFKAKLKRLEEDIAIVYAFRNSAAHRIKDRPFICENFASIIDRLFNVFFLSIEKLYNL